MEVKKINLLFKLVNIFMTVCCLVTAVYNYCGVENKGIEFNKMITKFKIK